MPYGTTYISPPAGPVIGRPKRDRRKQAAKRRQARRSR